ncbi:hypothetical protein GH714_022554 [Hevea brasiliensis]|uniref:Uncharacterized protein n=1 Tax=Hevea brasiliensis TaxID=3981 RepID=A0A6A6LNW1_HEVBR|nr:hypothetical protein GH714_022554 [Hevea brasiliensis]
MSDRGLEFFIRSLTILRLACLCCGFNPVDNYLVDCGSTKDTRVGNRVFLADDSTTIPSKNSFAFLNALEVVSVSDALITDDASTYNPLGRFQGLFSQALETHYRVNMGGPTIFPENDTLGRTWVSDQSYLVNPNVATNISENGGDKYLLQDEATPDIAPPAFMLLGPL